jgi:nucleotide-binding universal stress UspA family protein
MKILIATDGSDYSKTAIDECCRMIIHPDSAEVLIVSAYEHAYPLSAEPFALSGEYYQQMDEAVSQQTDKFITEAKIQVGAAFPNAKFPITTEMLCGFAVRKIIEKAEQWHADLIVVGSHGRGFWGRLLGSVSNGVVHHAPCSVLVVRKAVAERLRIPALI